MRHTIENECLRVTVSEMGAELQSIKTTDGTEYVWQGDPAIWTNHAPNLFPYVARLTQGKYRMDGQTYAMRIHGFAPYSRFAPVQKENDAVVFELRDNEETYAQYPRHFCFRIRYALEGNRLNIAYEVENRDERAMHFGLGGHPGFNVPLEEGLAFEDYRLRFSQPCTPVRVGFSSDCFVSGEEAPYALEGGDSLPLAHDLFDEDAIVLKDMAREVTLEAAEGARSVTVSYPDMPILGVWHKPKMQAPYVCIEPWRSLPSRKDRVEDFEAQENLVHLESGKTYVNRWSITVR